MRINGRDFTIVGIAPKGFGGVMAFLSPQWWLPLGAYETIVNDLFKERSSGLADRQNYALNLAGALKPGIAPPAAAPLLDATAKMSVQRELQRLDPQLPILSAKTMTVLGDSSLSTWAVRAAAALFSAFGVLALLLAAIGVYGLKAFDVSRRTREIGIRMALGATAGDVRRLVLREGGRTTLIGLGLGAVLAAGVGRLASGFLFRVSALDPLVLTIAALVLTAAAMLACYVPARRATLVEPLDALRTE